MKFEMSWQRWALLVGWLLFVLSIVTRSAGADPKEKSKQKANEIQMWVLRESGERTDVKQELAGRGSEPQAGHDADQARVVTAVLPGAKAELRFEEGALIVLYATLPKGMEPQSLELTKFERHGLQRVAYLGGPKQNPLPRRLLVPFRAQLLRDGSWRLLPEALQAGEYCFSPGREFTNYCFGVDQK